LGGQGQAEHDAFADVLRSRVSSSTTTSDLLTQTLAIPEARAYILDRVFDPRWHGPLAASTLRAAMDGLASPAGGVLSGGITKREIADLGRNQEHRFPFSGPEASC